jgi:hypothetical protein
MKSRPLVFISSFFILCSWSTPQDWLIDKQRGYALYYSGLDESNKSDYTHLINSGIISAENFFKTPFAKSFDVYVHPNRKSLEAQWQKDWGIPDFKSECWMVASGVATKLDLISPIQWEKEACEHSYSDKMKTQQLITHELFHVFHGQLNPSPEFTAVEGIDWLVEGFATYASGQLDENRMNEIRKAIAESKIPSSLDDFWKGNLRYGLSGSVVSYIDQHYGRAKLYDLLKLTTKKQVLESLKLDEAKLIDQWKAFVKK